MYGDNAAMDFGGGGFMPSQPSGFATGGGDPSVKKSGAPSSGLFPLTVKQMSRAIQSSTDDNLIVDGQSMSNVTMVGMLLGKEERATDISFMLDDGTGRVEVKRWIESPDAPEALQLHSIQHGQYVRIHGHLRTFQNKRTVVAFAVKPITDFNEITFHFLDCIFAHTYNTKSQGAARPDGPASPPTFNHTNYSNPVSNPYATPAAPANSNGMSECQRRVQAVFEEPSVKESEQGLHVDEIARRITGFSKKQVRDAVEFLVNEGYVYSTVDDEHFKSTNTY
ncbi:hypothetical protein SELMODRAFT_421246 [Selaginella moellendorffii]|uniref:Replication protein A C-terminal domain-containing protein n=1 Tax=Selaginella moellendorffii TaxID=88036 RepID=D8SEG6_SELML|nr:replication protein A 32 kDa subunit A [Selaginella moellendorffii]EFJ17203.1 hypothetical protein SELMODRAFT_421246 [Selaginella moellendorffii]|eukprot:XP_002981721.1 replication protein A 32 kDa subunit A [Selaginella moellendorffii]